MSFDLTAVRDSLGTQLASAGWKSFARIGLVDPPAVVVGNPESVKYVRDFGGTAEVVLPLLAVVSRADEDDAQRRLEAAVSVGVPGSVYTAIRELEAVCWRSCTVLSAGPFHSVPVGAAECVGVEFSLTIHA